MFEDQSKTDHKTSGGGEGATGAAMKTDEPDKTTQNVLSDEKTASPGWEGYSLFRLWANRAAARKAGGVTILHGDEVCVVEDLTPDGQLRLSKPSGGFAVIPFDDTVIQQYLEQLV